ncbi:hypothetical protein Tco_0885722 [Tanacetum coccineum]
MRVMMTIMMMMVIIMMMDDDDDDDELTDEEDNADNTKKENEEEKDNGGANQHNVSQELGFEQIEEDAHVTLTVVHDTQKTEGPMQSCRSLLTGSE